MNVTVFGLGYVGCVSLGCLAQNGFNVIGVDVSDIKVEQINNGKATIIEKDIEDIIRAQYNSGRIQATTDYRKAVLKTEVSIICVGTPSLPNGHLNLDFIMKVAAQIAEGIKEKEGFHVVAIRSTVMPGTAGKVANKIAEISGKKRDQDFAIVSNPEFLREGSAVEDYYNPPYTLIGTENVKAAGIISSLYEKISSEIIVTETKVAEIMKYVCNTFHALKISFANEVGAICKELDIDSHKVMEIFVKDKVLNISPYYLKPGFAYGGSCLPKDLGGFQMLGHDYYIQTPVIQSIDKSNEYIIKNTIEKIIGFGKKKIGFLGLSFKPGTDDLRNSPSVKIVETLMGKGYEMMIYDKNINLTQLTGTNKYYIDTHIPHLFHMLTSDICNLTNNSEVIVITTKDREFTDYLTGIDDKIIFDLVRLDDKLMSKRNYYGIAW
jgi:GDP-mannose 6-dehydrogenase